MEANQVSQAKCLLLLSCSKQMEQAVMHIPIHLLSPLISLLLPWSPSALLFQWFCCEKPLPVLTASQHLLGYVSLADLLFSQGNTEWGGGKKEIPWLREAFPPLGQQQAEKACAEVWMLQLFPHHNALVSSHIYLVFFAMCLLSNVTRKP